MLYAYSLAATLVAGTIGIAINAPTVDGDVMAAIVFAAILYSTLLVGLASKQSVN